MKANICFISASENDFISASVNSEPASAFKILVLDIVGVVSFVFETLSSRAAGLFDMQEGKTRVVLDQPIEPFWLHAAGARRVAEPVDVNYDARKVVRG
jgi:hypothetical protein